MLRRFYKTNCKLQVAILTKKIRLLVFRLRFPKEEVDKVNKNNLVVILGISTAAIIAPAPDAPKLGVPGDWSKPNKYVVKAANKSMAEWTVTLTLDK